MNASFNFSAVAPPKVRARTGWAPLPAYARRPPVRHPARSVPSQEHPPPASPEPQESSHVLAAITAAGPRRVRRPRATGVRPAPRLARHRDDRHVHDRQLRGQVGARTGGRSDHGRAGHQPQHLRPDLQLLLDPVQPLRAGRRLLRRPYLKSRPAVRDVPGVGRGPAAGPDRGRRARTRRGPGAARCGRRAYHPDVDARPLQVVSGGPPGPALGPPDRRCRPRHSRGGARGDLADHRVRLACRLRRAGRDEPGVERGVVVRRARRTL